MHLKMYTIAHVSKLDQIKLVFHQGAPRFLVGFAASDFNMTISLEIWIERMWRSPRTAPSRLKKVCHHWTMTLSGLLGGGLPMQSPPPPRLQLFSS